MELAEVLEDPTHFDIDQINDALADASFNLIDSGVHPGILTIASRLKFKSCELEIEERLKAPAEPAPPLDLCTRAMALAPHLWFLDRATGGGISLTSAGYLRPADIVAARGILPAMAG